MTMSVPESRRVLQGVGWGLLLLALAALSVNRLAPAHLNADVLLQSVMSLQRVTLFYWGQNRLMNFLPLLLQGIRDPQLNLYALLGLAALAHHAWLLALAHGMRELAGAGQRVSLLALFLLLTALSLGVLREYELFSLIVWHFEYSLPALLGLLAFHALRQTWAAEDGQVNERLVQEHRRGVDARTPAQRADLAEAETVFVKAHVARIDLDHRVAGAVMLPAENERRMEQGVEHAPGPEFGIYGQPRHFAEHPPLAAQAGQFVRVESVGQQPARRIASQGQRGDGLVALPDGQGRAVRVVRRIGRRLHAVAAPCIHPAYQPVDRSLLGLRARQADVVSVQAAGQGKRPATRDKRNHRFRRKAIGLQCCFSLHLCSRF